MLMIPQKDTCDITPANPGSGPGQAPGSRISLNNWISAFAGRMNSVEVRLFKEFVEAKNL